MAKKKNRTDSGPDAFAAWYGLMHGGRWPVLRQACRAPNRHFELSTGLLKPYYLDPASVLAALCLDIAPGQSVLDLCAAPGGKSLVIAQRLFGLAPADAQLSDLGRMAHDTLMEEDQPEENSSDENAAHDTSPLSGFPAGSHLVANERSATRRGRLRQVLAQHLPESCQSAIRTTGFDATVWGQHEQAAYDRILLDVPCSSERHLIQDPAYLVEWSPKRSQQLAQQAYAMGLSAGRALKTGGRLLYCTCALSDLENDQAVERIIERSQSQAGRFGYRLAPLTGKAGSTAFLLSGIQAELVGLAETTSFGLRIWPDGSSGLGPLYFSVIQKVDS
jgi:16S rRNA C967 or C1407 C5-methylase (RsmB/RsmF family)